MELNSKDDLWNENKVLEFLTTKGTIVAEREEEFYEMLEHVTGVDRSITRKTVESLLRKELLTKTLFSSYNVRSKTSSQGVRYSIRQNRSQRKESKKRKEPQGEKRTKTRKSKKKKKKKGKGSRRASRKIREQMQTPSKIPRRGYSRQPVRTGPGDPKHTP